MGRDLDRVGPNIRTPHTYCAAAVRSALVRGRVKLQASCC